MKLEYSPALQLALDRARQLAMTQQGAEVTPRHFLCGLLAEEEGKAATLMTLAGADWPRLQSHLGLPVELDTSSPPDLPLHPSLEIVMAQARELASVHGDEGSISTDHVLLALLTKAESLRQEMATFGFDLERL